jgi:hypothetical protein
MKNQKDSIEMMKKEHFEDNEMMKEKIQKRLKEIDVDSLYIDKKISENFEKIKDDQKDFKQFITELSNQRISEVKIDLSNEYKELLKKLSDSLDNKVTVMKNDEIEKKRIDDISAEGRIQGYIIEAEKRIKKNLEERIDKIQQTVEKMNIKINAE